MKEKKFLIVLLFVFLIVASTGFTRETVFNDFELYNHNMFIGNNHHIIKGTVINRSNKMYDIAIIKINLYDTSGNLIGNTESYIQNFLPGEKWKFKATCLYYKETFTYKIIDIVGNIND